MGNSICVTALAPLLDVASALTDGGRLRVTVVVNAGQVAAWPL
jgi:hypothetical protein